MMWQETLRDLAEKHRFKVFGSLIGLLFALSVWHFGFFWTLFIFGCVLLGYWVGKRLDEEPQSLGEIIDRVMPPR